MRQSWTPDAVERFWDYMSRSGKSEDLYFSKEVGAGVVEVARRAGVLGEGTAVLDFGCGPGYLAHHLLAAGCEVWGFDQSPQSREAADARNAGRTGWHGASAELPRDSYDVITCIETLEHLDDDTLGEALERIRSLLKLGGHAIFTTPNNERLEDGLVYCPHCDTEFHRMQHVRSFDAASLGAHLVDAGFDVVSARALNLRAYQALETRSIRALVGSLRLRILIRRSAAGPHLVAIARCAPWLGGLTSTCNHQRRDDAIMDVRGTSRDRLVMPRASEEIETRDRFAFGRNWAAYLATVDEHRLSVAEQALQEMLGDTRLDGVRFCDVGSGSGLHSTAAARLGANVLAFDFDEQSVACTSELARRFGVKVDVRRGSALDDDFLATLGTFDVVYSWGVLHHTGDQWKALDLVSGLVQPGGRLFIALYNDQGGPSRLWARLKSMYNRGPVVVQKLLAVLVLLRFWALPFMRDVGRGRPLASWRDYRRNRGMSPWYDVVDWAGGWPFEVSKPGDVLTFFHKRGFCIERVETVTGHACNEFVFRRASQDRGAGSS